MKYETADRKLGWSPLGIIGLIFAPMGALFIVLGLVSHLIEFGDDPEDPVILLAVFGGIGLIFLILGLCFLVAERRRRSGLRRALEEGRRVMAAISGVRQSATQQRNGYQAYVVECHYQHPDTGETHVCFSRSLRYNPADILTAKEVPVYLDPLNDKICFVDIDAVLPKVVIHGV